MKKNLIRLLLLLAPCLCVLACSDDDDAPLTPPPTPTWKQDNESYFAQKMAEARTAIAEARATWGDEYAAHSDWRAEPSYAKAPGAAKTLTDSVCWQYLERGERTATPCYNDSVRVNYRGQLIPTEKYPNGQIFDHSGPYSSDEYIFSTAYSVPALFCVSNLVPGFITVLQHMHVGDRVRVYIPQDLGYGTASTEKIPAHSTLIFDVQLRAIYRVGTPVSQWQ